MREYMPTDRDEACFEAGITLGALYHQFIGTPVSADSQAELEEAMENSAEEQIGVETVDVDISGVDPNRFGYDELAGDMLSVDLRVEHHGVEVAAQLAEEDGYPMMRIVDVQDGADE